MTTKTKDRGLAAEREEASRLRGRHEARWGEEAQERADAERRRQAAFNRVDERIADVEHLAAQLRGDRDRQQARVRGLEQQRKGLSIKLRANAEVARERLAELADTAYPDSLREWLRRLPVSAEATPPPVEVVARYLLATDPGFGKWLLSEMEAVAAEDGPIDPRTKQEIAAELEQVKADLAEAKAELDRRERAAQVAGHAIRAAEMNVTAAVDAFLAEHGGQR